MEIWSDDQLDSLVARREQLLPASLRSFIPTLAEQVKAAMSLFRTELENTTRLEALLEGETKNATAAEERVVRLERDLATEQEEVRRLRRIEIRATDYRAILQRIRLRHEAEDTGQGFVRGDVAWAMYQDACEALEE